MSRRWVCGSVLHQGEKVSIGREVREVKGARESSQSSDLFAAGERARSGPPTKVGGEGPLHIYQGAGL